MLYPVRRLAYVALFSLSVSTALATPFPRGCEISGFSYAGRYLVLNGEGTQTFFLLQNRSNQPIQLQRHETRDVFMSPKLESNLAPSNWSAFASDEQSMNVQCTMIQGEAKTPVNCSDVLDVCRYPRVRFALSNMGNYWVATNKTQDLIIKEAVAKGIYLKW